MKLNTVNADLLVLESDYLNILVLGGIKIGGLDRMRVTLKLLTTNEDQYPLRYNLDLYNTDQVEKLIRKTGEYFELELVEVRKHLMFLIEELEKYRIEKLGETEQVKYQAIELTKEESNQAINYLSQKNLIAALNEDIGASGVIGEETNRLLMYLVFTSRKLNNPLHIISFGASGVGKSHLQEKVGELIPTEDRIEVTTLTKNSLYYFESEELDGKLLLIEDLDGTTDESLYAIRELQSKKRLSKTIASKDSRGNIKTKTVTVTARVTIAGTTTRDAIYEDNSNRSILIYLDESEEQDHRIMEYQKQLKAGIIRAKEQEAIKQQLVNLQRALEPITIVNPYANSLKLPEGVKKPRRTMNIYLSLIEAITYLHQYQRKKKAGAILTSKADIQLANELMYHVLLRKVDDLSSGARRCLEAIKTYLAKEKKQDFTTREIRFKLLYNANNLKRHLKELVLNDYISISRGNRYVGFEYRLLSTEDYASIQHKLKQQLSHHLKDLQ